MRIISLVPAWTEWVAAFGALDELVGRSHACDYPDAVRPRPAVTESVPESSPFNSDETFRDARSDQSRFYSLRGDLIAELQPDLILIQFDGGVLQQRVDEALKDRKTSPPAYFSASPSTFKDVLNAALRLGKTIGRVREAMEFIGEGEKRVVTWRRQLGLDKKSSPSDLPTVVCIESVDPMITAGRWVPGLVELAGGRCIGATEGEPSKHTDWASVMKADPDVLAVVTSSIDKTRRDVETLAAQPGWGRLRAVREGRVIAFDGSAYFDRPGPRLYRSIELLVSVLHPERLGVEAAAWEMAAIRM